MADSFERMYDEIERLKAALKGQATMIDHFRPWHVNPFVVLDFETTGVDPETCEPVQFAAVRFEGGQVVSAESELMRPDGEISDGAREIHGIGPEDVKDARPPDVVLGALLDAPILRDAVPVAYNARYDRTILHRYVTADYVPALSVHFPWFDPLIWIREFDRFVKGKGRHRLEVTCERWGVPLEGAHDAAADAAGTGRLLGAMREHVDQSSRVAPIFQRCAIGEVLRLQAALQADQDKRFAEWKATLPEEDGPEA